MSYRSVAFERQVAEAVSINQGQGTHYLMNSKSESRACHIPRITFKMGNNKMYEEVEKRRKEQKEEDELESKIKLMKRLSKKRQLEDTGGMPRK